MTNPLGIELIIDQMITKDQLNAALDMQETIGGTLEDILLKMNYIDDITFGKYKAKKENLEFRDLHGFKPEAHLMNLLPKEKFLSFNIVPLEATPNHLHLAMSKPENVDIIGELEFQTGKTVKVVLSTAADIEKSLYAYYYGDSKNEEEIKKKEIWDWSIDKIISKLDGNENHELAIYIKCLVQALHISGHLDKNELSRFIKKNFDLDDLKKS